VQSLLVKPVNTDELLRQLEALLITHQDHKMMAQKAEKKTVLAGTAKSERQATAKRAH
jgi:DNA-binding response OmpR family regulator